MPNIELMSPASARKIKEDNTVINEADILESQIGGKGAEIITDTVAHTTTKVFVALQVISDAVISAYTTDSTASITGNSLVGVTISGGTIIYGRFKSITLASGQILAYKGI